jgi:hypothetical protein
MSTSGSEGILDEEVDCRSWIEFGGLVELMFNGVAATDGGGCWANGFGAAYFVSSFETEGPFICSGSCFVVVSVSSLLFKSKAVSWRTMALTEVMMRRM